MSLRYWALIIGLGAVWGCSFLFNAVLIREISPLWVSAGRVSIGALICWVFFFATRKKLPTDPELYPLLQTELKKYERRLETIHEAEETPESS